MSLGGMKLIISQIEEGSLKYSIKKDFEEIVLSSLIEIEENVLKVEVFFLEGSQINAGVRKIEI